MKSGRIVMFAHIPSDAFSAAAAVCCESTSGHTVRLEAIVKEGAPTTGTASAVEIILQMILPPADHFFAGQLAPMRSALAGWLKEQLQ
jgi:alpha/beta superfamily hydrolase